MGLQQILAYGIADFFLVLCALLFTKSRFGRRKTVAVMTFVYLALLFLLCLRAWLQQRGYTSRYTMMLETAVGLVAITTIAEYRDCRAVFGALMSGAYGMCGHTVWKICNTLGAPSPVSLAVLIVVQTVFLGVLVYYLLPSYRVIQEVYRREWRDFCMVLLMLYACMYLLFACFKHPGVTVFHNMVAFVYLITIYLLLMLAFRLFDRLIWDEQEERKQKILTAGMEVLKREVGEVHRAEKRIAEYNQNNLHFVQMIGGMMAEKDYDGVNRVLEQMQSMPDMPKTGKFCANMPLDGVLSYYVRVARERHISIGVEMELPEKTGSYEWELAVVMGNLLDNAIQACVEVEPYTARSIVVKGRSVRGQCLLEIRNTYAGMLVFDETTRLPVSAKGEGHGLGMHSVADFVRQHDGVLDCGTENGWYFVRILL